MDNQDPTTPTVREVDEGNTLSAAGVPRPDDSSSHRERRRRRRSRRRPGRRIWGLRLATKLMLVGLPLALVLVPWASFGLLDLMESTIVQWQSNNQKGIAENIATLFHGEAELFDDLPTDPSEAPLVAPNIPKPVRLNAQASEWGDEALVHRRFGPIGDGSFTLSLGTRLGVLYAYMEITDDVRVYRDLKVLRLDNADQVRISFLKTDGDPGRITVTLSESGDTTAYTMDSEWAFADDDGRPANDVRGFVRETATGYALEMRLRLDLLGSRQFFTVSFVDVDDPVARDIRAVTTTAPSAGQSSNLVVVRSPELLQRLDGRGYQGMRIRIIDAQKQRRAERGAIRVDDGSAPSSSGLSRVLVWLDVLRAKVATARDWLWPAADRRAVVGSATWSTSTGNRRRGRNRRPGR